MYDAVVIGSGPGGYVCAIKLAQLGRKVALVEKNTLGGTCTNWGCIPTKAMLTVAHLVREVREKADRFGINLRYEGFDLSKIMSHAQRSVTLSRKGIEFLLKKNGVEVFFGTAEISEVHRVKVLETGDELEARNIVLAHGSIPADLSPFSDVDGVWTSNDVFKLERIPDSLLIIGGGAVGVEFASFFGTLGTKVTIVELAEHLLPLEDADVADEVKKSLLKLGVTIHEASKVTALERLEDGFRVSVLSSTGESIEGTFERVLLAAGRKPNVPADVRDLGVEVSRGVRTDEQMRTSVEGVYAVGDVRGDIMLAHVASQEGIVAAKNIAGIETKMDYRAVPSVIFTWPEVASVGVREKESSGNVKVFKFPFSANGRARTMLESGGFVKIIADVETEEVLGMAIVGPHATELIMEGVLAVKNRMKVRQLEESIHPHPTLSETTLGALEGLFGKPIHL